MLSCRQDQDAHILMKKWRRSVPLLWRSRNGSCSSTKLQIFLIQSSTDFTTISTVLMAIQTSCKISLGVGRWKAAGGHARDPIEEKKAAVGTFVYCTGGSLGGWADNRLLADNAKIEMKEKQGSQKSYTDTRFLVPTSNQCEFISAVGCRAGTGYRKSISPFSLECLFFCMQIATCGSSTRLMKLLD